MSRWDIQANPILYEPQSGWEEGRVTSLFPETSTNLQFSWKPLCLPGEPGRFSITCLKVMLAPHELTFTQGQERIFKPMGVTRLVV